MHQCSKILHATFLLLLILYRLGEAEEVFVLKTSDIIPYNTCIEGLRESLSTYSLQVFNMEGDLDKGREIIAAIQEKRPRMLIAVGPQASFLLSEITYPFPKFFCMVLNPQKLIGQQKLYSGVSLNMPLSFQLRQIKKSFPERKRVGLFFSKSLDRTIIESFLREAASLGLVLVTFPITSASDILPAIDSKEFSIDTLLMMPDEQINSQKIVEYIIKESLRRKIPVVGYNRWFASNGAILSFIIEYRDLGLQAGDMALRMVKQGLAAPLTIESPARIKMSIDLKTAQKLGIQISPEIIQQADEVIR